MSTPMMAPLIAEMKHEFEATKRVLEAMPGDKLDWRPHPKSMSLGKLGMHIATATGGVTQMLMADTLDIAELRKRGVPEADSKRAILDAADENVAKAVELLEGWTDDFATGDWSLTNGGQPMMTAPRVAMLRMIAMSHVYHHRGQMTVYLRLLDAPVPSVYGPSADVDPFAQAKA
ncbi:MAG: damage-inducible protein DinB [Phycisphaera sp.]|nr:damage-inducible protein DinB [Phycisphaera sp.]